MVKFFFRESDGCVVIVGWCNGGYARRREAELRKQGFEVLFHESGRYLKRGDIHYFTYYCERCRKYHVIWITYYLPLWFERSKWLAEKVRDHRGVLTRELSERKAWEVIKSYVERYQGKEGLADLLHLLDCSALSTMYKDRKMAKEVRRFILKAMEKMHPPHNILTLFKAVYG